MQQIRESALGTLTQCDTECINGVCQICPPGQVWCGRCVNTLNDNVNCGRCSNWVGHHAPLLTE